MIALKIDVKKISKADLFTGAKGTYLDVVLIERPDEYGNDGFVSQSLSKEKRAKGERGPIIGNWKELQSNKPAQKPQKPAPKPVEDDDIPF